MESLRQGCHQLHTPRCHARCMQRSWFLLQFGEGVSGICPPSPSKWCREGSEQTKLFFQDTVVMPTSIDTTEVDLHNQFNNSRHGYKANFKPNPALNISFPTKWKKFDFLWPSHQIFPQYFSKFSHDFVWKQKARRSDELLQDLMSTGELIRVYVCGGGGGGGINRNFMAWKKPVIWVVLGPF